jgi:excisionase family DNA binding protein
MTTVTAPPTFPDNEPERNCNPDQLYSYDQVARRVGVSVRTLRRGVTSGRLAHRRVGKLVRFTDADVIEILNAWRVAPRSRLNRRNG